jgi:hypothetical protein
MTAQGTPGAGHAAAGTAAMRHAPLTGKDEDSVYAR